MCNYLVYTFKVGTIETATDVDLSIHLIYFQYGWVIKIYAIYYVFI